MGRPFSAGCFFHSLRGRANIVPMDGTALTREEIFLFLTRHRARLQTMGVSRIALFGSRARGDNRPGSDVDVLVSLRTKSFDAYMDLKFFLEDGLGGPVDLVLEEAVKPRLRPAILAEAVYAQGF